MSTGTGKRPPIDSQTHSQPLMSAVSPPGSASSQPLNLQPLTLGSHHSTIAVTPHQNALGSVALNSTSSSRGGRRVPPRLVTSDISCGSTIISGTTGVTGPDSPGGSPGRSERSSVRVMVRVRPFSNMEVRLVEEAGAYMQSVVDMRGDGQCEVLDPANDYSATDSFYFDACFWSCRQQDSLQRFAGQQQVYVDTGRPALAAAWDGINSCIFAYGQTGSGKTHTMMGPDDDEEETGVIPRLCREMFTQRAQKIDTMEKAGVSMSIDVEISFAEIYNEKVWDLLGDSRPQDEPESPKADSPRNRCPRNRSGDQESPRGRSSGHRAVPDSPKSSKSLKIREHPVTGPYVVGLVVHRPQEYADMMELITKALESRHTAATKLNDRSSRSHAMFRITLLQTTVLGARDRRGVGNRGHVTTQRRANINLVDLAGSENVKRSGAEGSVLLEAQKINLSLTTLRRVIDALIEGKQSVPYRESSLTWLLRQDLGGNSRTVMLATVSPHTSNRLESLRTLQYAMKARSIVNKIRVNEDDTMALVDRLQRQLEEKAAALSSERGAKSAEELERLEEEKQGILQAQRELRSQLESSEDQAKRYKEMLERTQNEKIQESLKNATVLQEITRRLEESKKRQQQTEGELQDLRNRYTEQEKASTEREKARDAEIDQLKEERDSRAAGSRQNTTSSLDPNEATVQYFQESKKVEQLRAQLQSDAQQTYSTSDISSMSREEAIELAKHYGDMLKKYKQQLADEKILHDKESKCVINEMMAQMKAAEERHALELLSVHAEKRTEVDKLHKQKRRSEAESTRKLHRMHEGLEQVTQQLGQLREENDSLRTQLPLNSPRALRQRAEQRAAQQRELERETSGGVPPEQLIAAQEDLADARRTCDRQAVELKAAQREMHTLDAEIKKWTQKITESFDRQARDVEAHIQRMSRLDAPLHEVQHALDALNDGDFPEEWTVNDVRRELRSLKQSRAALSVAYIRVRPNIEGLQAAHARSTEGSAPQAAEVSSALREAGNVPRLLAAMSSAPPDVDRSMSPRRAAAVPAGGHLTKADSLVKEMGDYMPRRAAPLVNVPSLGSAMGGGQWWGRTPSGRSPSGSGQPRRALASPGVSPSGGQVPRNMPDTSRSGRSGGRSARSYNSHGARSIGRSSSRHGSSRGNSPQKRAARGGQKQAPDRRRWKPPPAPESGVVVQPAQQPEQQPARQAQLSNAQPSKAPRTAPQPARRTSTSSAQKTTPQSARQQAGTSPRSSAAARGARVRPGAKAARQLSADRRLGVPVTTA